MRGFSEIAAAIRDSTAEALPNNHFNLFSSVPFSDTTGYIDGGNACLINTPWYSLHFIRAAFCTLNGASLNTIKRWEFFILSRKSNAGSTITSFGAPDFFHVQSSLEVSCLDSGNAVRESFEKALLSFVESDTLSFLVKDGLLDGVTAISPIIGLAKSTNQIPLPTAYSGIWFTKQENGDFLVRLNARSYTPVLVQLKNCVPETIFPKLSYLSRDMVFPGYPYGLIIADRFARVSNSERDYLLCMLESFVGKNWQNIRDGIRFLDSHKVLDSIS